MALGGPGLLQTLAGIQEMLAIEAAHESAFANLETSVQTLLNNYLELTLDDISRAGDWIWLEREFPFNTKAEYADGTVAITKGSTTVTGVGTLFNTSNNVITGLSHFVQGTSGPSGYRVASITSDTELELNNAWAEDTLAAGSSYQILQTEYEMPAAMDFLHSIEVQSVPGVMRHTSYADIIASFRANRWSTGNPRLSALIQQNNAAVANSALRLVIYPAPDREYQIVIKYRAFPTFPSANFESTHALTDAILAGVMYRWARHADNPEAEASWRGQYRHSINQAKKRQRRGQRTSKLRRQFGIRGGGGPLDGPNTFVPTRVDGT